MSFHVKYHYVLSMICFIITASISKSTIAPCICCLHLLLKKIFRCKKGRVSNTLNVNHPLYKVGLTIEHTFHIYIYIYTKHCYGLFKQY